MINIFKKFPTKGGPMEKTKASGAETRSKFNFLKSLSPQTAFWIGATMIFAALFFMSSVLDMKVHVTFGQSSGPVNSQIPSPGTAAPAGGIASQVGGC